MNIDSLNLFKRPGTSKVTCVYNINFKSSTVTLTQEGFSSNRHTLLHFCVDEAWVPAIRNLFMRQLF